MRKIVVTFGGRAYDELTALTVSRGPVTGADEVWVYDDRWLIDSGFVSRNAWLFEPHAVYIGEWQKEPRKFGFGWCSWKAFVIQSALDRLEPGDVALYLDGDTYPIAPFGKLFEACTQAGGVFLFYEKAAHCRFTKQDCGIVTATHLDDGWMACGRFSLWEKGSFIARQMLAEWWAYSVNPRCMLWDESTIADDDPDYHRNSTEQSVLTCLARKYCLPLHRTPDQFGAPKPGDPDVELYSQLFEQKWATGNREDTSGSLYRGIWDKFNCDRPESLRAMAERNMR